MSGRDLLENGEEISAIFLTEHMREDEVPTRCYRCERQFTGLIHWQYIGGRGEKPFCLDCFTASVEEEK